MITHSLIQGSPEWFTHRATHFNASDAPAMLGVSPYKTRTQLLREIATGIAPEADDASQRRFDEGHRFEGLARPLAEAIIGQELYPVVGSDGRLSASFDGLTIDESVCWEHKTANAKLLAAIKAKEIPDQYRPQMEQQLMLSGAERCLFSVTRWDGDVLVEDAHCWYLPDAGLRDRITQGWAQFAIDLENYQPTEVMPAATGAPIKSLPALMVQLVGEVKSSNLVLYRETALSFIQSINTDLQTDQDFADAEKTVKFCDAAEKELDTVKKQALSQTASIDELFRTVDMLKEEMRSKRLELDRLVKARKEAIRIEIVQGGKDALAEHLAGLDKRLGKPYLPVIQADFAGVMKGKKSIASLRDAVSTELARVKIEANAAADNIEANLKSLRELAAEYTFLFADTAQIVMKANDDLVILIKSRISDHKAAEEARIEAENRAKEATLAVQAPVAPAPPATPAPAARATRPPDDDMIKVLARHYSVNASVVIDWLGTVDLVAARDSRPVYAGTLRAGSRK